MLEYIQKGLKAYKLFINKEIHYIYKKDGKYKEVILKAKKQEFMHLCGVTYLDPKTKKIVSPKHFYELVDDGKISPSFLIQKNDGTTEQKLQVIGNLKELLSGNIRIMDGQFTFYNFSFNKGLRSRKQIFALALIEENKVSNIHVPWSLLNLKTNKAHALKESYEVCCIFSRVRGQNDHIYYETEQYSEDRKVK